MSEHFLFTILILCVMLSKGQQQKSTHQQQFTDLIQSSNNPKPQINDQIQKQQNPNENSEEPSFRPITFPSGEEELTNDRLQSVSTLNNNLLQNIEQKTQQAIIQPIGAVMAATVANDRSHYTNDRFDYIRNFAWTLFQGSKLPLTIGNLVLSPIQSQLQLSLLRTVATGLTEEEIGQAIQEVSPSTTKELMSRLRVANDSSIYLGVANAIFLSDTLNLNGTFVQEATNRNIDIMSVDFNKPDDASYKINNWISNATNNTIKNIFKPDLNRPTRMLLANTILFNGEWKYGFNELRLDPFETTDKLIKNVSIMRNTNFFRMNSINLSNGLSGRWIELPYRDDNYSMLVVIPEQRHHLDEFIRSMCNNDFQKIFKQLLSSYKKMVHLSMPKFSVSSSFSVLNSILKMGIVDLFSITSQLPYLATNERFLRVDDILQQGILSVDERGTVASVATISHVVTLSLNNAPEEVSFKVDQPFLSIIVDKRNKIPIFISKIYDP